MLSDTRFISLVNERFIPCWESVRPVPKITIDLGDGRVIRRTLTGNTILSVLTADGRMVDALPGIYTPEDFLSEIRPVLDFLANPAACGGATPSKAATAAWHRQLAVDLVRSEVRRTTLSKAVVESPLLSALGVRREAATLQGSKGAALQVDADPRAALEAICRQIEDISHLPATADRLRSTYVEQPEAKRPTPGKLAELAIRQDSQTNVRLVRPAIHLYFTAEGSLPLARPARDAIYRRVLHLPVDDPNLGLADVLLPGTPE